MRRGWRVVGVLAVLALACVALTFSILGARVQKLRALHEVVAVVDGGPGVVVVYTQDGRGRILSWRVEDSGRIADGNQPDRVPGTARTEACAAGVCYRVATTALRVESRQVERTGDSGQTYTTAWKLDAATAAMLARSYPDVGDPAVHLVSRSVVVHAVAGGHVVFVANGRDGLLQRDAGGAWRRLGSPASGEGCCYYEPPLRIATDPPPTDLTPSAVGVVAVAILLTGLVTAIRRRRWPVGRLLAVVVLALMAGYATERAGHFPDVGMFPGWLCGVGLIVFILGGGCWLAWWFVADPRPPAPAPSIVDAR